MDQASPPIAIFYTTKNDFQEEEGILSCLKQDYSNFEVYILDDSDEEEIKKKIDGFILLNPNTKLIRRKDKAGFKAGNLNNALKLLHPEYSYFAVCDADTVLPTDFLGKLVPYTSLNENIAFVQANQRSKTKQKSFFAQVLSFNTDLHWKHYVPVKELYGFTMFYGHGAIIRTDAWKQVGGFPEIITEDLAFSSVLREKGYYGVFVPDVICWEDYPDTYKRFRNRNRRWVSGTTEYLLKYFSSLVKAKNVSGVEKIDVFLSAVSLLLAFPFLIYILIAGIILPFSQNLFKLNIPVFMIFPHQTSNIFEFVTHIKYQIYWTADLFVLMTISSMSQILPVIVDLIKTPVKMLRYIAMFNYFSIATTIVSSWIF